jgi:hypothetical protein
MMDKLPNLSPTLYRLAKEHNFKVELQQSGKYHIIIAQVFHEREVLNEALEQIRKRFKGAYVSNYSPPKEKPAPSVVKEVIEEKIIEKVPQQEPEEIVQAPIIEMVQEINIVVPEPKIETIKVEEIQAQKIEKIVIKEPEVQQSTKSHNPVEKTPATASPLYTFYQKYFEWYYLIIIFFVAVFIKYYIKFKKIYDEY